MYKNICPDHPPEFVDDVFVDVRFEHLFELLTELDMLWCLTNSSLEVSDESRHGRHRHEASEVHCAVACEVLHHAFDEKLTQGETTEAILGRCDGVENSKLSRLGGRLPAMAPHSADSVRNRCAVVKEGNFHIYEGLIRIDGVEERIHAVAWTKALKGKKCHGCCRIETGERLRRARGR